LTKGEKKKFKVTVRKKGVIIKQVCSNTKGEVLHGCKVKQKTKDEDGGVWKKEGDRKEKPRKHLYSRGSFNPLLVGGVHFAHD
jgi:hypothetical protein